MRRLQDRVALVTGSSSGIGVAVAKSMAGEGAKVVVQEIKTAGGQAIAIIFVDGGMTLYPGFATGG